MGNKATAARMAQEPKFVFTLEEAEAEGVAEPENFWKLVHYADALVPTPISGAISGVVGRGSSGRVFLGVNIEFPGLPLDHSISPNKFLLANLVLNSEDSLRDCVILDIGGHEVFQNEVSSLLSPQDNHLALSDPDLSGDICSDPGHCSHLKCRALAAANRSNASYTDCPSGVALVDDEKKVYQGWYVESLGSYRLCLGPLQAALVDFVVRGEGKEFDKIIGAVLVEKKDATVPQEDTLRFLLKMIVGPNCDFNVYHCYEKPEDD